MRTMTGDKFLNPPSYVSKAPMESCMSNHIHKCHKMQDESETVRTTPKAQNTVRKWRLQKPESMPQMRTKVNRQLMNHRYRVRFRNKLLNDGFRFSIILGVEN
jgi:hypothetical protein